MRWLGTRRPSGQEVEVDVIDVLAALGTAVEVHPIPSLGEAFGFAEPARRQQAAPHRLDVAGLHRHDRRDVALGDDQQMNGSLRIDVPEGEDGVVLVLDIGWALPSHDLAEEAVGHGACIIRRPKITRGDARWERVRSVSCASGGMVTTSSWVGRGFTSPARRGHRRHAPLPRGKLRRARGDGGPRQTSCPPPAWPWPPVAWPLASGSSLETPPT